MKKLVQVARSLRLPTPAQGQSPGEDPSGGRGNSAMAADLAGGGAPGQITVQEGDTLWGLAERELGDPRRWEELYEANRDVIGDDPDLILPGQLLTTGGEDAEEALEQGPQEAPVDELLSEESELDPDAREALATERRSSLEERLEPLEPTLTEAQREVVLARVQVLSGPALVQEMKVIEHALLSANPARALRTMAELQGMIDETEGGEERLTPEIMEMYVNGVADARSDSDRGQEGVLGVASARRSAEALLEMSDDRYQQMTELLGQAGQDGEGEQVEGADAGAEQALLLKALGARTEEVQTNWLQDAWSFLGGRTEADDAMDELSAFASDIRGTERDELMRTTSPLDIHDQNTSTVDPDDLLRGVDARGDNDGFFQRFNNSCGPTTSQIVAAEADPVLARQMHQEGIDNPSPFTDTAVEQGRLLEEAGEGVGGAVSRQGTQARGDVNGAMTRMIADDEQDFSAADMGLVRRYLAGDLDDEEDIAEARELLDDVRDYNDGHPTEAEVRAILRDNDHDDKWMYLEDALNEATTPETGIEYTYHDFDAAELDEIEERLVEGEDVPFRIGYTLGGGHFMTMVDVRRNDDGSRRFLITDPWSGATRWVQEPSLISGDFTTTIFDLGEATVSHHYDEPD